MSLGSSGKYGISHLRSPLASLSACFTNPFLIASWCEPENAETTNEPPYGARQWIGILLPFSTTSITDSMSEKSRSGEIPSVYMFKATVTRSTLPVLSPFPKRHPSTLSAPASIPSSVAATPQPLSLWQWREMITFSLSEMFLEKYSTWSA